MKKTFLILLLSYICISTFSKPVDFNFNIPTGKLIYSKQGDESTTEALFYNGRLSIDLEESVYSFLFFAKDYSAIEKEINVRDISSPINIIFSAKNDVKVTGNVKSGELNIGSAKVTLFNSKNIGYTFITDIFGNFSGYVPKGNYRLDIDRKDYELDKKNAIVYEFRDPNIPYNININLKEVKSFIKGQVIDENGDSIPYPSISIKLGTKIKKITGDEFGMFSLPLDPGIITILCEKDGYIENGTVKNIEKNTSITNIEIPLTRIRASISGIVTDGIKPIRGAKVFLRDNDFNKISNTKTDENGFYEFYKIPSKKELFITVMNNNQILKKSESFDLEHDITNFNLILDK